MFKSADSRSVLVFAVFFTLFEIGILFAGGIVFFNLMLLAIAGITGVIAGITEWVNRGE